MKKAQRRIHAEKLLYALETLRFEWESSQNTCSQSKEKTDASRRERLKTIEAEAALLRLIQSEDRLIVQLAVGFLGFIGGSAIGLLFK